MVSCDGYCLAHGFELSQDVTKKTIYLKVRCDSYKEHMLVYGAATYFVDEPLGILPNKVWYAWKAWAP